MLKEFKYIYLFRRCAYQEATIVLKKRMWNAPKIERQLHRYFAKSRFRLTKEVWRGRWIQSVATTTGDTVFNAPSDQPWVLVIGEETMK